MFDTIIYILTLIFYILLCLTFSSINFKTFGLTERPYFIPFHIAGIVAVLFMLSFIVYILRKRKIIKIGKPYIYLKAHIFLSLLGSILALLHSTLKVSAINSGMLLGSLTLIVTSGIIGRYIYIKIVNKTKGYEAKLENLKEEYNTLTTKLVSQLDNNTIQFMEHITFPEIENLKVGFWKGLLIMLKRDIKIIGIRIELRSQANSHPEIYHYKNLIIKKIKLDNQIKIFKIAKSVFIKWKKVHIPFTILLFLTLLFHILTQIIFGNTKICG